MQFSLILLICVVQILAIRAQVEELVIDEESLAYLGEIGQQASLRYVHLYSIYSFLSSFVSCINRLVIYIWFYIILLQRLTYDLPCIVLSIIQTGKQALILTIHVCTTRVHMISPCFQTLH